MIARKRCFLFFSIQIELHPRRIQSYGKNLDGKRLELPSWDAYLLQFTGFLLAEWPSCKIMKKIQKNACFCLFPKRHGDLYKTLQSQLTGGLSLIFCRLAISGETKILSHEVENPKTVKKVLGLDANSLYLYVIAQNIPTSYFCRYKKEDFRSDPYSKFGYQFYQWLSYVVFKQNTFLKTRFDMG